MSPICRHMFGHVSHESPRNIGIARCGALSELPLPSTQTTTRLPSAGTQHIHIHTHTRTQKHKHVQNLVSHTHTHTHTHTYIHTHARAHTHTHTHTAHTHTARGPILDRLRVKYSLITVVTIIIFVRLFTQDKSRPISDYHLYKCCLASR